MKYNTLLSFREALANSLAKSTALTYYKAIDYLLKDQILINCKQLNIDKVLKKLKAIKYKSYYSKYKNAFLKFCDFININLDDKTLITINNMSHDKTKKYRSLKQTNLKDIKNHIKVVKDKRLKLSYKVMLATGLRVSELSQITKDDCKLKNDCLELSFIGKGGKHETVTINDKRLITELINLSDNGKRLFYSANYLQTKAKKMGFKCIDLRRAFAKSVYKQTNDINEVQRQLRHSEQKNTNIYLSSKIVI